MIDENGYKRLAAAIINQAADDCKNYQLDAVLYLLTDAEMCCAGLDFDFEKVFSQARKWYTRIELSEAGGTVSSQFLEQLGLAYCGAEKNASVKTVAPCIKAAIRKAIESHLTDEA